MAAFAGAVIAALVAMPAAGQEGQDPFRIQVQVGAVSLGVSVTDDRGRFVSGLEASDFEVFEDGARQELTFFAAEAAPLTLIVLLDASLSMRASLDYVKEAAATFVDRLWEGDRAMIGEFNDRVRFSSEFTEDRRRLTSSILALNPLGPTALYDASIMALERLHFADGDRKALLIFTDGDDSRAMGFGSELSAGDAIEAARMTDAVVYAIGFEGNGARVNKRFLRRLTSETGGAGALSRANRGSDRQLPADRRGPPRAVPAGLRPEQRRARRLLARGAGPRPGPRRPYGAHPERLLRAADRRVGRRAGGAAPGRLSAAGSGRFGESPVRKGLGPRRPGGRFRLAARRPPTAGEHDVPPPASRRRRRAWPAGTGSPG